MLSDNSTSTCPAPGEIGAQQTSISCESQRVGTNDATPRGLENLQYWSKWFSKPWPEIVSIVAPNCGPVRGCMRRSLGATTYEKDSTRLSVTLSCDTSRSDAPEPSAGPVLHSSACRDAQRAGVHVPPRPHAYDPGMNLRASMSTRVPPFTGP